MGCVSSFSGLIDIVGNGNGNSRAEKDSMKTGKHWRTPVRWKEKGLKESE